MEFSIIWIAASFLAMTVAAFAEPAMISGTVADADDYYSNICRGGRPLRRPA
jgi:hypothetical protein